MIEEIKRKLLEAEEKGKKVVTFHYLILTNASKLENEDPAGFCRNLGLSKGYPVEFTKMMNLAKYMKEKGVKIT